MEISNFRAVWALREFGNLTAAGKHLGLSTSTIFSQIRQLEEEIGQKLYEQIGKTLRFTNAGELLTEYAAQIVQMHDTAVVSVQEQGISKRRVVRIGCGSYSSVKFIPNLLRALIVVQPNTDVRVITSDDQALLRDLGLGILDAVFMSLSPSAADLIAEPLWRYEMVLVTPPRSGEGGRNNGSSNFRHLPLILSQPAMVREIGFPQCCPELELESRIIIENTELGSIKQLVKLGLGLTILPNWSVVEEESKGLLTVAHLTKPRFHNYGAVYRQSGYRPKALDDLLAVARQWRDWWPLAASVFDLI
jgi:DNA-binding transcriptional LysR family regulator